jgi:lysyl-tRNA synthetase class 2
MSGESLEAIIAARKNKIKELYQIGINPYPEETPKRVLIGDILKNFSEILRLKKKVGVAGRIIAVRKHGGITFMNIKDDSGLLQLLFKRDVLKNAYELVDKLDIGDFIWASGYLFKTKSGEKTLEVKKFLILVKSLRPLPSQWYGLEDVEERFRKRFIDILINPGVKERFEKRIKIIRTLREFLEKEGFLEVETPILQPLYGGTIAKPFKTHHDLLNIDLYLRIAPELYLKRLLVAGFEKIYEIGKAFRNEGIDREHNPEFTLLELYWAYQDRAGLMQFLENLIKKIAKTLKIKKSGIFKKWKVWTFDEALKYSVGVNYQEASREKLLDLAQKRGLIIKDAQILSKGKIADEIIKKIFLPTIGDPIFLIDHPTEISPLAKQDFKHPEITLRFQAIANGWEFANGFSELNDPQEQRKRFEAQEEARKKGDYEAMRYDEDFVEALEYGMPPTAGLGIGIDRLVAWLTDAPSLKEIIFFPMLKPKRYNK